MSKILDKLTNNVFNQEEGKTSLQVITFKHGASGQKLKRKGYEVTFKNNTTGATSFYFTIEPVQYSNGDKWFVYGSFVKYFLNVNTFYAKNLTQVYKELTKNKI